MKNENTGYPSKKTWIFIASGFAALSAALGISLAMAPDNSPCGKIETEIVTTWNQSEALKAESKKALDEMGAIIQAAEQTGNIDKAGFAKAKAKAESTHQQMTDLTAKVEQFPDRVAQAGCSAERWEKFQASHPEIFG